MAGDGKKTRRVREMFTEASTWAAIAAIAATASGVPPEVVTGVATTLSTPTGQATTIVAVAAGLLGMLIPEKK